MAELAGSIIGIVSAGTKVALVLSQLAADVGSAGQEARMIGSEIRSFCTVLKTLGNTIEKLQGSEYYAHCFEMVQDMTLASMEMFTELLNAVESLRSIAAAKEGKDGKFSFIGKVQWVIFQKPKILVLRAAIEAYKSNPALMLGTLDTAEKVARRVSLPAQPDTCAQDDQERTLLESLELDCRTSMIALDQAERQYEDHIAQSPVEQVQSTMSTSWMNTADVQGQSIHKPKTSNAVSPAYELLERARSEVKSIRFSLLGTSIFDGTDLQAQITCHSHRLSRMIEADQKRLSQRWSTVTPLSEDGNMKYPEPVLALNLDHQARSSNLEAKDTAKQNPRYQDFQSWVLCHSLTYRRMILAALEEDIISWSVQPESLIENLTTKHPSIRNPEITRKQPKKSTEDIGGRDGQAPGNQERTRTLFDKADALMRLTTPEPSKPQIASSKREVSSVTQATNSRRRIADAVQAIEEWKAKSVFEKDINPGLDIVLDYAGIHEFSFEAVDLLRRDHTRKLAITSNHLKSLPHTFSMCTHLRYLNLGKNRFETFPDPILQLASLEILDLKRNSLSCIPSAISGLQNLKVLCVAGNKIQGISHVMGILNLNLLDCTGNPIVYPSPHRINMDCLYSATHKYIQMSDIDAKRCAQLKAFLKYLTDREKRATSRTDAQAIAGKLPPALLDILLNELKNPLSGLKMPRTDTLLPADPTIVEENMSPPDSPTSSKQSYIHLNQEKKSIGPTHTITTIDSPVSAITVDETVFGHARIARLADVYHPSQLAILPTDTSVMSQSVTMHENDEHCRSRPHDGSSHTGTSIRIAAASSMRRRSNLLDASSYRNNRYSTVLSADLEHLRSAPDTPIIEPSTKEDEFNGKYSAIPSKHGQLKGGI